MAVGDLLFCFVSTEQMTSVAFGRWMLGPVACKLISYVQVVCLASTTFLMTAMSIDTYQVKTRKARQSLYVGHTVFRP